MATTTTRRKVGTDAANTDVRGSLLTAIGVFLEAIDSIGRRTLTDAVSAYENIAVELRPVYDAKNATYRASQTNTTEDKRTDLPISTFHTQLTENLGEGFTMKLPALRNVVEFWKLHNAEAFAGYNDACTERQIMGSWTGYVKHLRDLGKGYISSDGKETGKRPKSGESTDPNAGKQLTSTNFVEEVEAPNDVERCIIAQKRLHDMTWQVAEAMARLNDDQRKAVRDALKLALANA